MPEFSFQYTVLLVGLFLLLLLIVIAFLPSEKRDLRGCFPFLLGISLIVAVVYILDPIKWYQCRYTVPNQITLAGHVSNPDPNNYLVILYKGDEEINRSATGKGRFAADDVEDSRDGYFELSVPNEFGLNRCSMSMDFEQDSSGFRFLGLGQKTVYMWHHFAGVETGTSQALNEAERKKTYTLVVLPNKVNRYPQEIKQYSTYLDGDGQVAINLPIKTYAYVGNTLEEHATEFFTHAGGRLPNTPEGLSITVSWDVRDAWVVAGSTYDTTIPNRLEPHLIDRDNCTGSLPPKEPVPISSMYMHEVQFQQNADLSFNVAVAASKAAPSLGFTQGHLATIEQPIIFDVPRGVHRKYKVYWQDVWRIGSMAVDFGGSKVVVPFRARIGMNWTIESIDVACPG